MARFIIAELVGSSADAVTYLVSNRDGTEPQHLVIASDGSGTNLGEEDILSGAGVIAGKIIRTHRTQGEWPKHAAFQS